MVSGATDGWLPADLSELVTDFVSAAQWLFLASLPVSVVVDGGAALPSVEFDVLTTGHWGWMSGVVSL